MPYICPICEKDPSSHSFKKVGERNGINYYTCLAKSTKYNDRLGILEHYKGVEIKHGFGYLIVKILKQSIH